jgi:hypothetical protein
VHYGTIPGTPKPTLYKAGSEKILATFRIAVEPEVTDLSDHDERRYRVICRGVLPSGEIVGAGIGEASTNEEKYKWRGAVCQEEFDATPENMRRVKWSKGYQGSAAKQTNQVRTNPSDLANTVLKMAKKRAQIDLTLTATGASDVFDQDIEDLPEEYREGMNNDQSQRGKPAVNPPQAKSQQNKSPEPEGLSEAQKKMIFTKIKSKGINIENFKEAFNFKSSSEIKKDQLPAILEWIEAQESAPATTICDQCGEPVDVTTGKGHAVQCPYWEPA